MTATRDLVRIAQGIVPPAGAVMACLVVEHEPGRKLPTGDFAGEGGRTRYRAGFLADRAHVPVGPAFERLHDASRLVDLLNGEAGGRPRAAAGPQPVDRDSGIGSPEAPGPS